MLSAQRRDQFLLAFLCALIEEEDTPRPISKKGLRKAIQAVELCLFSPKAARYSYSDGSLKTEAIDTDLAKLQKEHAFIEIRGNEILITESGMSASTAFELPRAWEDLLDEARLALQYEEEQA